MSELISITEVAKAKNWSYQKARNTLQRNPKTRKMAQKIGHAVCYPKRVLEVLNEPR